MSPENTFQPEGSDKGDSESHLEAAEANLPTPEGSEQDSADRISLLPPDLQEKAGVALAGYRNFAGETWYGGDEGTGYYSPEYRRAERLAKELDESAPLDDGTKWASYLERRGNQAARDNIERGKRLAQGDTESTN
jgi:hypothetical protein